MIGQFTYTASPWGKSGEGWMVFQQSKDIAADVVKRLYGVYHYEEPKSRNGDGKFPVQFAYLPDTRGQGAVLAQTTFTGTRWFGEPRPGDFFAHVFLLDNDAVKLASEAGHNPVRLYMSRKIQSGFPEALKDKALRIFRKETAWEPPPVLPELKSLADLGENRQLSFEAALDGIPEHSVRQLGPLVRSIVLRALGKAEQPIVFDSKNEHSQLFMALALDLMPPSWRARTWFAVHFEEAALRRLPEYSSLTFYGTDVNARSDLDSGIVSGVDFTCDELKFRSRKDVRLFKQQLDLLGTNAHESYRGLIDCRKVVAGGWKDLGALKSAVAFAERFPGLRDEIDASLSDSLSRSSSVDAYFKSSEFYVLAFVAHYELGLRSFDVYLNLLLKGCVQDMVLLDGVLQKLSEDSIRDSFINAVVGFAKKSGATNFVNKIIESKISFRVWSLVRNEDDLFRLAVEYRELYAIFGGRRIEFARVGDHGRWWNVVRALEGAAGPSVNGLSEIKKYLTYCQELEKIRRVDDVARLLKDFAGHGFPKDVDVKEDILKRVGGSTLSVRDIVALGSVFEEFQLQGKDFVCERWGRDQSEIRNLREKLRTVEYSTSEKHKGPGCAFVTILCLIGIGVGIFIGKKWGDSAAEQGRQNGILTRRVIFGEEESTSKLKRVAITTEEAMIQSKMKKSATNDLESTKAMSRGRRDRNISRDDLER